MRKALRGILIAGWTALLAAVSCGDYVNLGATGENLPGGASNDAGGGTGGLGGTEGLGGFGGTEGSGGSFDFDAAADSPSDAVSQPDGLSPTCQQLFPVWPLSADSCETVLPQPWASIAPPLVFLGVNVMHRSTQGDDRIIGYVGSEAACAETGDGWYLITPLEPRRIVLCPETCAAFEADGGRLYIAFGCPLTRAEPR